MYTAPQTLDHELVIKWGLKQPFEFLVQQGKPLRDFQLVARHRIKQAKRLILSLDKGTGKTLTVLSVFEDPAVHKNISGFTVVILCPEKGIGSWLRDIQLFPEHVDKFSVVRGSKGRRGELWRKPNARYFICTPATFLSDMGIRADKKLDDGNEVLAQAIVPKWLLQHQADAFVIDEFHRIMRRRQSKFFKYAEKASSIVQKVEYLVLMSGSAVSKDPSDLWPALHLVDRKLWSSFWKYVYTWCEVADNGFGKQIVGPKLDRTDRWRAAVGPYVFHRTRDMLGDQLPPKSRFTLDVEMEPSQKKLHDTLMFESFAQIGEGEDMDFIFASNTLVRLHKLRTALICPKALSPQLGYGAGIEAIYEDARDSGLTRYFMHTPFKAPIPFLADYLQQQGCRVWTLQGGVGLDEQNRRLEQWRTSLVNAEPERPSVLISTTKYAESWECPEASYGYALGYEWDPEDNKQAEDRILRLGKSVAPVFWYYVRHRFAYDEEMLQTLIQKGMNREAMFEGWGRSRHWIQSQLTNQNIPS